MHGEIYQTQKKISLACRLCSWKQKMVYAMSANKSTMRKCLSSNTTNVTILQSERFTHTGNNKTGIYPFKYVKLDIILDT